MHTTRFTTNWNNKLNCKVFTTIRAHNPHLRPGIQTEVILKGKPLFTSEILKIITTPIGKIPDWVLMNDTGYSYGESLEVFRKFMSVPTTAELMNKVVDIQIHKHI